VKRSAPLRSSAVTARAWRDRSRERALVRAREAAGRVSAARKTRLERVRFKPWDSAGDYPCERCARLGIVRRAAHWHHWLAHQHLRVYVRTQRLSDEDAATLLRRLLHDRRNISATCLECHGSTTLNHGAAFTFEDVPPAAFAFAGELGPEWLERLRRTYARGGP
jgi:hypothetical protein